MLLGGPWSWALVLAHFSLVPHPDFDGPHHSMGVHESNSRRHTKAWESIIQVEGPH